MSLCARDHFETTILDQPITHSNILAWEIPQHRVAEESDTTLWLNSSNKSSAHIMGVTPATFDGLVARSKKVKQTSEVNLNNVCAEVSVSRNQKAQPRTLQIHVSAHWLNNLESILSFHFPASREHAPVCTHTYTHMHTHAHPAPRQICLCEDMP